jgi:hypothetical protein
MPKAKNGKRRQKALYGWHFINSDMLLNRYHDGRKVEVGKWLKAKAPRGGGPLPVSCRWGMHASPHILQALSYRQGTLCYVAVRGEIDDFSYDNKFCGLERKVLWVVPAEDLNPMIEKIAKSVAAYALKSNAQDPNWWGREWRRDLRKVVLAKSMRYEFGGYTDPQRRLRFMVTLVGPARIAFSKRLEKMVMAYRAKQLKSARSPRAAARPAVSGTPARKRPGKRAAKP